MKEVRVDEAILTTELGVVTLAVTVRVHGVEALTEALSEEWVVEGLSHGH